MCPRTRPSHAGCAETPISTKIIPARSSSERGRKAERIPIGNGDQQPDDAPPTTSENVTAGAQRTISLTSCRL